MNLGDRLTMFETCSIAAVPFHSARTTFFPRLLRGWEVQRVDGLYLLHLVGVEVSSGNM